MEQVKIGVIGCGNISGIYLENLQRFNSVTVSAVADLRPEAAAAQAAKYGVKQVLTTDELLADPDIDIILNLTTPAGHADICRLALQSGHHVYVEKPLSIELDDGRELVRLAGEKHRLIGGAPDTFLGAGLQTCRDLIDQGVIGRPIGATAFMTCHGHESWHPAPTFYYQKGGGPMFDMGPYYLTALYSLLGPARRVTGSTAVSFAQRTITSQPLKGTVIDVEVPTHVTGILELECGAVATILTSFDVWHANLPFIEIYGSEGSLSVPDPNTFGGPVRLRRAGSDDWETITITRPYGENSRGLGVADMAACLIRGSGQPRAGGEMALHVLETMHGIHQAAESGCHYQMTSRFTRPDVLDPHWRA